MSSEPIGILVATMTGTAELCAEEIASALARAGLASETKLMDNLDVTALAPYRRVVIVSSTYGHGDVPDNGQALFASIEVCDSLDLDYAVFGLGDMTYATTFCEAGTKWDSLLASKGARRMGDLHRHDASCGELAEDMASHWAEGWARGLKVSA